METSQSAGRIAILTVFTLLFAVAWRSDVQRTSPPESRLAATARAGYVRRIDRAGYVARGAAGRECVCATITGIHRFAGSLADRAVRAPVSVTEFATQFSGTPALLGRSTHANEVDVAAQTATSGDSEFEPR